MRRKAKISEIFCSYQGEGTLAGQRHVFVRFADCNLECRYCDTRGIVRAPAMDVNVVLKKIKKTAGGADTVSFTGGEPLMQSDFIKEISPALKKAGYMLYLETNGTLVEGMKKVSGLIDIVAMDIKFPSDCGATLWDTHEKFIEAAGKNIFVKAVISANTRDSEVLRALEIIKSSEKKKGVRIPFVLQPVTPTGVKPARQSKIEQWLKISKKKLGRAYLIPQMHRFWEVR